MLPVKKVAEAIAMSVSAVSRLLGLLQTNKIIECVDGDYSFVKHKAKEHIFLGAPLPTVEVVPRAAA